LAEDVSLVQHSRDGPARLHDRFGEAVRHRVAGVVVGTSNHTERPFVWLLIEIPYPGFKATLRLIESVPSVLGCVRHQPGTCVSVGLVHLRAHLYRNASK